MKMRSPLSRDYRELHSAGTQWRPIAIMVLALASAAVGLAQRKPDLLRTPMDSGAASVSGAEIKEKAGITSQGAAAAALSAISAARENGKVVVTVSAKGPVDYRSFTLSNPRRLVVDFVNTGLALPFRELPVNMAAVKQIRVSQIQVDDHKVARVVFDLDDVKKINHQIVSEGQTVKILFPADAAASSTSPVAATLPPAKAAAKEKTAAAPKPQPPVPAKTAASTKPVQKPSAAPPATAKSVAVPKEASPAAQKSAPPPKPAAPPKAVPPAAQAEVKPNPAPVVRQATPPPAKMLEVAEAPAQVPAATSAPTQPVYAASAVSQQATPRPAPPVQPAVQVIPALAPQETRFGGAPLTLDLIEIPLVDFFRLMAEEGGINIVIDPEIRGTLSIKVVKVPWDQILEAALTNNGLDKQIEGNLVRIAKKTTLQQEAKQHEDLKKATTLAADIETKIKRLNYAKAATLLPVLSEQKSVRGTVVVDERSNSLVLTDIPSYLEKMIKLVETLDMPQPQVEIEARIVSANRDFARDLGVQFGFVQGNLQRVTVGGPNTFGTIGGTRPSATPTTTFSGGNPVTGRGASSSTASSSAGVSTGTSTQNAGNFNVNLPANKAFGGVGVSIGNIFDTFLLDAAITAGENRGLAKLISQPKVTAQNNSAATITQGLRFPVQIIANNTIAVQFQNAALTLVVTPQITYEGNIVLDLQVENNTPDFSRQVNGIPSIRTSESKTRVLVSDGGTTVIGGIIIESDSNTSDRVPGLASLPGIGNLFKRTSLARSSQEVLFFITPKIIK